MKNLLKFNKTWLSPCLAASALALLSFPIWQQIFTKADLPVQVQMSALNTDSVKVYWDNPERHPHAYQKLSVKPTQTSTNKISSTTWHVKVEALAEKNPEAKSSEVWILDISTPENRVDWSKALMGSQEWELLNDANGSQGKVAVARTGKPQSLEVLTKGTSLNIALLRHPWSGKVRVTANGQVREINLYSNSDAVEKLYFEQINSDIEKTDNYEIKVVKTPWHRLKFLPENIFDDPGKVRVESIRIGNWAILPEPNGEFVLPFYFWNRFTYAISATVATGLGLTFLLISIRSIKQHNPNLFNWFWFNHVRVPKSIVKLKVVDKEVLILPYQSFKYFGVSLAVVITSLLLAEGYLYYQEQKRVIKVQEPEKYQLVSMSLPSASARQTGTRVIRQLPQLSLPEWQQEDKRINQNNKEKILTSGSLSKPAQGEWIWRSAGFPVTKSPKTSKRILIMGDSFVWGDGYANMNDIWWRQLQRELTQRGYDRVEVIAAGLNGASTRQQLEQAKNIIQIYKPNLVIWGYVTNDPDEGIIQLFNYSYLNEDPIINLLNKLKNKSIFPRVSGLLFEARSTKVARKMSDEQRGYEYKKWEQKLLEGKNFELYRKTVKELGTFQTVSEIPGFMMTLPSYPNHDMFMANYSQVIPLFEAAKIPVYNILDDYIKYYSALNLDPILGWRINPANGHPGTAATYFHAMKAANILEAKYPQVLGQRKLPVKSPVIRVNDWVPYNLSPTAISPGVYTFKYPESSEYMLRLPVARPFVQLNLEIPVGIKEIRISGTGLKAASLDITAVDSKRKFDDGTVYSFGEKQGTSLVWNLEGQASAKVNTIRLSADFKSGDKQLTLTLIPQVGNQQ